MDNDPLLCVFSNERELLDDILIRI